ncbi:ribonuclease E/G [Acetobacter sp.]|uniref:ribonuclease E/G n=1 Tax=Acetobacter sp. TaxID=440 RepID=UPI0025C6D019|nr:ribonuclease E/G [Acetobacter sp.]MCH4089885.1 ribonuclease E/G [Acetobacter sp.]MCI1298581.1 ribonuclease E/G [Acetobacter sp.]MCI1315146.1 ribonuclease E/G [Acetobacter sp.]
MAAVKGTLRLACSPGEARIAVFENGTLQDYGIWTPGHSDHLSSVFLGRVTALAPALGGVFVHIGLGEAGFMPVRDNDPALHEGDAVSVQLIRCGMGGKGPRLKRVELSAPATEIGLIQQGPSPLEDMAQRWAGDILVDHPTFAARVPSSLRDRVRLVQQAWTDDIHDAVDDLLASEIPLPGGMRASITPTPALVAIDMDTASASGMAGLKQTTQFALNRDTFPALVRQICLRNLSGAILIDPAGLSTRKRQALRDPMEEALKADPLKARCLGITALGLIEIVRTRIRPPLHELTSSPHGRAMSALRDIVASCADQPLSRPILEAGVGLVEALATDTLAVQDVTTWCGHPLTIRSTPNLPTLSWSTVRG